MDEIVRRPRGRPRKHSTDSDTTTVLALERGLKLLELLAREKRTSLTEIAMQAGMPPSTARRLLLTLLNYRFADFDEANQDWMIGIEAFRVGSGFLKRIDIVEAARNVMAGLVSETGETSNLAIADDGDVVFVSQVESPNPIRACFQPGTRSQMHASGVGKALMAWLPRQDVEALLQRKGMGRFTDTTIIKPDHLFAELDRIRDQGWSIDNGERYTGMCCVAAPIFGAEGDAAAAISISGPSSRFTKQTIVDFSAAIRHAAANISTAIGGKTGAAGLPI